MRARDYAAEYVQQRAHVAQLKELLAGRPTAPTPRRAPPGWGIVGVDNEADLAETQSHDPDAILEAQLADLKQRFGRA